MGAGGGIDLKFKTGDGQLSMQEWGGWLGRCRKTVKTVSDSRPFQLTWLKPGVNGTVIMPSHP